MAGFLKAVRLLGDEGRLRILRLLEKEELSVAELQEILSMGQSTISMQLSPLKEAGLIEVRKAGQKRLYRLAALQKDETFLIGMLHRSAEEIAEAQDDDDGLRLILRKRKDKLRSYFDELAGRFGRNYLPGRSWKGLSEMLLKLLPPLAIADLGAGEGAVSLMLAQRARQVIAVDSSEKMVEYGSGLAKRNGVKNLEYRLGDLEELPVNSGEVDMAIFHQSLHHAIHPKKAIEEAWRILRPGGRIVILDLLKHNFEDARDLYADVWLGFSQVELIDLLRKAHFRGVDVQVVDREEEPPHFQTLMAIAEKAS